MIADWSVMTVVAHLRIPPLTLKIRPCALIWSCALNRTNMHWFATTTSSVVYYHRQPWKKIPLINNDKQPVRNTHDPYAAGGLNMANTK